MRVAVVGGGVTGITVTRRLAQEAERRGEFPCEIHCFDQGRGWGGRTCHRVMVGGAGRMRPVAPEKFIEAKEGERVFRFDHGCQFFRADSEEFTTELLSEWLEKGWAAEWKGKFGVVKRKHSAEAMREEEQEEEEGDFFGLPSQPPIYCGTYGMHSMCAEMVKDMEEKYPPSSSHGAVGEKKPSVTLWQNVRVSSVSDAGQGKQRGRWELVGPSGELASHDCPEEAAEKAEHLPLTGGGFDVVIVTDASCSMGGWHRASAGLPETLTKKMAGKVRVVLFTALVTFAGRLSHVPLDGITFSGHEKLWFASRNSSKPGMTSEGGGEDSWTIVSSPSYAVREIEEVPMQCPVTKRFIPQSEEYLLPGPVQVLIDAFLAVLQEEFEGGGVPEIIYRGGQRWGSAFPAPPLIDGRDSKGEGKKTVEILNVKYDASPTIRLVPLEEIKEEEEEVVDFFSADPGTNLYYAGDFCSSRPAGVESSALSGLHCAQHVANVCFPRKSE